MPIDCAFYSCISLTSIELPNGLTTIVENAFSSCISLTSIEIPSGVTTIGSSAFESCGSLTSVEIPNSVTTIENSAFCGCRSLTSIEIPNSVVTIGGGSPAEGGTAFRGCSKLEFKEYGNAKYLGNKENEYLALIEVTDSRYSSYSIHESTKVIAGDAFRGCGRITEIVIPQSVISICNVAFNLCGSLKKVYYKGTKRDWNNIVIGNSNSDLLNADRYYYSETQPSDTQNKYWHFVDGEIVEW